MEEEKMVKKENEITNMNDSKNKNGIIAVLIVIIIALIGAVIYFAFIKKDNTQVECNSSNDILSNDEAIAIAKDKLGQVRNMWPENIVNNEIYSNDKDSAGYGFNYYGTVDEFKNKFYSVYSSKLDYKDVLEEYKLPSDERVTNVEDNMATIGYAISDNKVYLCYCVALSGSFKRMENFTVDSVTSDMIKVNYVVIYNNPDPDTNVNEPEFEENGQIVLVKESNDWKILKGTIADMCDMAYIIGE